MSASCLDLLDHLHGSVSVVGSMNVDYTVVTERLPKPGETVNGGPLTLLPGAITDIGTAPSPRSSFIYLVVAAPTSRSEIMGGQCLTNSTSASHR